VAAARQLEDVESAWHNREGDRTATVIFEVEEASSRAAWEPEGVKVAQGNVAVAWELEEGDMVTTVFEVGDASSRETQGGSFI
jgi:hypothetical protein